MTAGSPPLTALVLAGGGARGAYEVGALAALLPALGEADRPRLLIGTSVGAINSAWLAAHAHLPADVLAERAAQIYAHTGWRDVIAPLVSARELGALGALLSGTLLGRRSSRVPGLLDPTPLAGTVARLIPDFGAIGRHLESGRIAGAAVAATSALTARTVVFHESRPPAVPRGERDDRRGIDYAAVTLTAQHVRASAAIPALFPAVHIDAAPGAGWYVDGGTRLNTPLKPALWLGGERVIAVGLNPVAGRGPGGPLAGPERPDVFGGLGTILSALLADPLASDIATLARENGVPGRRRVPYIFVRPDSPTAIGALAARVFAERYRGRLRLGRPELAVLGRLVEGDFDPAHGELLSYLFFDPDFFAELVTLGRRDAERWLAAPHDDGLWQLGPE